MSTLTVHRPTWTPTPEITQHNGRRLHPKMIFFAPPPPDIGRVVTAYSSVTRNGTSRQIHWHLVSDALFLPIGLAGFTWIFLTVLISVLAEKVLGATSHELRLVSSIVSFPLTLLVWAIPVRMILRPCIDKDCVCSYVGEQGIAEYRWTEADRLDEKVLRFADFTVLRKKITNTYCKEYSNRGWHYSGTEYCLVWDHARGESIRFTAPTQHTLWFTIKRRPEGRMTSSRTIVGTYYSKSGRPSQGDAYYLAVSAERIWTLRCLQRAQTELERSGTVRFPVAAGGLLEVKPGWLKVVDATGTHQYSSHDVELNCKDGKVVIERVDPEFPRRRSDACVIDQAAISNLEAFLALFHIVVVSGDS